MFAANDALTIGIIIGALAGLMGAGAVVILAFLQPAKQCAGCGEPMPKVRKPANKRQMLWGGWTCPKCGGEMDRKGRRIEN